ncbi:MAG: ATP cone domain-containing protein [Myxococcota bacterium]|nr:ATP cone domain-containing protein [Myxococcota bacterium]
MASQGPEQRSGAARDRQVRIWVEDGGRRRPFMRGIMVHSLMARGMGFEDAYRLANRMRETLRGREVVDKSELAAGLRSMLSAETLGDEHAVSFTPDIQVTGAGRTPFSKGLLSQSLLAAALDPNEAFDVAREIERAVLARGSREIDRNDLRELTHRTLADKSGAAAAERYLVWRRHQESGRPLLLLLGGATGVGKTSLALEVAHRLGIGRVLSTDSIRQIMRIMLSRDLVPTLHASSYDAGRAIHPAPEGDDAVVEGFRAQAASVCVGARASLDRAVAENSSLVLDGVAIVPGLLDLGAYAASADVIFMVVAALDEKAFAARFDSRAKSAQGRAEHRYLKHLDDILRIQDHLLDVADQHDVPIVDNVSFDRSVLLIIRHAMEALRQREKPDGDA